LTIQYLALECCSRNSCQRASSASSSNTTCSENT